MVWCSSGGAFDFYPRSPCGERPPNIFRHCTTYLFLSTLSLRRATMIHPLLCNAKPNFYPRSPCGERLMGIPATWCWTAFLSTLSLRRATCDTLSALAPEEFLSTLSLRRATMIHPLLCNAKPNFYPRSPCGERRLHFGYVTNSVIISIHALLAESDPLQFGCQR